MAKTLVRAETQINNDWSGGANWFLRTDGSTNMEADLNLDSNKIIGLLAPDAGTDAANKSYVDSVAQGLDVKTAVRAASTQNEDISALTDAETIDGVSVVAGDRVLLKDQTDPVENGIYLVSAGGWDRTEDANLDEDIIAGMFMFVTEGTTQADTGWVLVSDGDLIVDTDPLEFSKFATVQDIIAGDGLEKIDPRTLNVITDGDTMLSGAAGIAVNAGDGLGTTGSLNVGADDATITVSATGVAANLANGLHLDGGIAVQDEDASLNVGAGGVSANLHNGLTLDATNGIMVEDADDTITVAAGGVSVNAGNGLDTTGDLSVQSDDVSLTVDASGVRVSYDSTADTIELGGDGIRVSRATEGLILIGQGTTADTAFVAIGGDATMTETGAVTIQTADDSINSTGSGIQVQYADGSLETVAGGIRLKTGTGGHLLIAQGAGSESTYHAVSGDATISSTGVLTLDGSFVDQSDYVARETPTGTVDGTNTTFTLANAPVTGSEMVFVNGILKEAGAGNDYTISGDTITFEDAPMTGDRILITYIVA